MRLEITTPPTTSPASLAISPDGKKIVFSAIDEGRSRLLLRSLDSAATRPLAGTDGAVFPFWSPDNRSVGFFADGKLKRIDIDGGSVQTLANAPAGRGGAWNRDATILFAPNQGGPIFRISSSTGGELAAVTRLELPQQASHRFPSFLPDGRHFLYNVTGGPETRGVYVGQLGGSETQRLLADADAGAVYASSGQLLFVHQETLFTQGFDPIRLALNPNPSLVAETAAVAGGVAALSASGVGTVVYRTGSAGRGQWQFAWFDRSGKQIGKVGEPDSAGLASSSLSPDGRHAAMNRTVKGKGDIWMLEFARGVLSRFTFDATVGPGGGLVWYPNGSRIVFNSNRRGSGDLYQKPVSGAGSGGLILETAQNKASMDISPDGRFLLHRSNDPTTSSDIWALPLDGDPTPVPIARTRFDERDGQFSPDGKWVAYQSNETGRFEIFVQPFPGPGDKTQISTNGGAQMRWPRDGKELFYIAEDGRLMAVPIRLPSNGQSVEAGRLVPLFPTRVGSGQAYMVSRDGQRFLMSTVVQEATSPITVILNWKSPAK